MMIRRKIKRFFSMNGQPFMNQSEYKDKQQLKYLKFMKPDRYIQESAKLLNLSVEQVISSRINDKQSYDWITLAAIKKQLTIPMLDYKNKKQDGLHRVIWAKKQGLKKIPVFVYKK